VSPVSSTPRRGRIEAVDAEIGVPTCLLIKGRRYRKTNRSLEMRAYTVARHRRGRMTIPPIKYRTILLRIVSTPLLGIPW
jgi:hypothetical protein